MNSEFSFSLTGCLTKVKEPCLRNYLLIDAEEQINSNLSQEHCCIAMMKNKGITLSFYKNIYISLFLLKRVKAYVVWEKKRQTETNGDGGKQRQIAILTHSFLATLWDVASAMLLATRWHSPWQTESPLAAGWDWLSISHGHLHISFHNAYHFHSNTWLLPLIYTDASCAEKSLIDIAVKGQYWHKVKYK